MGRLLAVLLLLAGCQQGAQLKGTTIIGDTDDRIGPYPVITQVDDPDGFDRLTLHVRPGSAGEAVLPMNAIRRGVYRALIPGQPPFTRVRYFVQLEDGDQVLTDPANAIEGGALFSFLVRGTACERDLDCGPGEHCDDSRVCRQQTGPCTVDADCGNGFRCGPLQTCLLAMRACERDEGCLLGEICDVSLGQCVPQPRCGAGLECPIDFVCDQSQGLCERRQ